MTQSYNPETAALVIVDPYNDFMSEGGKLYEAIKQTADASGMYEHLRQIIPAARAVGIKIFVVPHHRSRPDDFDGWKYPNMFQTQGKPTQAFAVGSWGGEFNPEFGPQEGDIVVKEHWAQNGFANTDFDALLKQHGIEKLIFVGLIANSCIEATARYGMEIGYHVTLVVDATAAFNPEGMVAAATNAPMYAHAIVTTEELLPLIGG